MNHSLDPVWTKEPVKDPDASIAWQCFYAVSVLWWGFALGRWVGHMLGMDR